MASWSEVNFSDLPDDLRLDSEYYQPEYLDLDRVHEMMDSPLWETLDGGFIVGPFGSAFLVENYVADSPYRYIRGRDVKPFFLLDDDNCYMPEEDFTRLRKYELREGDLLVSVVGTLGNVSVVTHDVGQAIFSCKSTAYRPHEIDPYYLCAYLNSSMGQSYLQRMVRGHVQTGLNLGDLKRIPICLPSASIVKRIGDVVRNAYAKRQSSAELYTSAEGLLLSELGLGDLDLSPTLFYERPYADVQAAARFDAEHYQPVHESVIDCCKQYNHGWITLHDLMARVSNGVECREFVEDGVPYLRVGDIDGLRLNTVDGKRITEMDAARLRPKIALERGDVVMVRSGSIGQTAVVPDGAIESILSSHLIRLRQHEPRRIRPLCLALMLSSPIGVEQTRKHNNGAVVPEVSQSALRQFIVPLLDDDLQVQLEDLIGQSHDATDEARRLLDEARGMVETAILGTS